jgi:hypothetical protein
VAQILSAIGEVPSVPAPGTHEAEAVPPPAALKGVPAGQNRVDTVSPAWVHGALSFTNIGGPRVHGSMSALL